MLSHLVIEVFHGCLQNVFPLELMRKYNPYLSKLIPSHTPLIG